MQKALIRDPLTGVYSRAMLNARLEEELERARRYQHPFTLLLLDLDNFKSINDTFGHHRGDLVLIEFARRIEAGVRGSDSVFRYGGDEFVILLPNTAKEKGLSTAQRLLESVNEQPFTDEPPLNVSLSMGLASHPEDDATAEGLFDIADQRHQSAKRLGRGQVVAETIKATSAGVIDPPSRLIERDMAQAAVHQFLNILPETNRSVLQVAGPSGSGRTRLLAEIRKIAHLRGYAVMGLDGRPANKNRPWSALLAAEGALPDLNFSLKDDPTGRRLAEYLYSKGQAGLILVIDGLVNVDKTSLDYLRELFYAVQIPQIGLVFSDGEAVSLRTFPFNISLQEIITLKPISPASLRIWLRQSLQWEAPHELITWLHRETGGYPRLIQSGLEYLYDQQLLQKTEQGWTFSQDLTKTTLAPYLAQKAETPRHNLPELHVEIVDRTDEVSTISALIQKHRFIMLCGPGGVGKTTLAIHTASVFQELFPDGIFFVKLNTVASLPQLAGAIGAALRLPADGSDEQYAHLIRYLNEKSILLILDHYQPLLLSPQAIEYFLRETHQTHFLVTSRKPLSIAEEVVLELKGLEAPPAAWEPPLLRYDACQLFMAAARRAAGDTHITADNQSWIAQICRLVQGFPLAIELAGAWVQTLDCEEIAQRIARSQALSSADHEGRLDPRQVVDIVLDAFWELLSEADRNTLNRLTTFSGQFRRETAQRIAGASPFFLDALASKALLAKTPRGYYEMPESLRSYLSEKFRTAADDFHQTQSRHAQVYGEYALQLSGTLEGSGQRAAYQAFEDELENFLAAWAWAVSHADPGVIQHLLAGLAQFYLLRGSYLEAKQLFIEAYQQLNQLAHQPERPASETEHVRGLLLVNNGKIEALIGNQTAGREMIEEGLQILVRSQLPEAADALITLAEILQTTNHQQAESYLKESLRLYRQQGNLSGVWHALNNLGIQAARYQRFEAAQSAFDQGLQIARETNDQSRMARTLNNLGYLAILKGEYDLARETLNESMALARDLEIPFLLGAVLDSLGKLECNSGNYAQASGYFRQALEIARQMHAIPLARAGITSVAELWGEIGRVQAALGLLSFVSSLPFIGEPENQRLIQMKSRYTAGLSPEQVLEAQKLYTDRSFFGLVEEIIQSNVRV